MKDRKKYLPHQGESIARGVSTAYYNEVSAEKNTATQGLTSNYASSECSKLVKAYGISSWCSSLGWGYF